MSDEKRTIMVTKVVRSVTRLQVAILRAVRERQDAWWGRRQNARAAWARVRQHFKKRARARAIMRAIVYQYMEHERERWCAGPHVMAKTLHTAIAVGPTAVMLSGGNLRGNRSPRPPRVT